MKTILHLLRGALGTLAILFFIRSEMLPEPDVSCGMAGAIFLAAAFTCSDIIQDQKRRATQ